MTPVHFNEDQGHFLNFNLKMLLQKLFQDFVPHHHTDTFEKLHFSHYILLQNRTEPYQNSISEQGHRSVSSIFLIDSLHREISANSWVAFTGRSSTCIPSTCQKQPIPSLQSEWEQTGTQTPAQGHVQQDHSLQVQLQKNNTLRHCSQ